MTLTNETPYSHTSSNGLCRITTRHWRNRQNGDVQERIYIPAPRGDWSLSNISMLPPNGPILTWPLYDIRRHGTPVSPSSSDIPALADLDRDPKETP